MDTYIEHMVRRRKSVADVIMAVLIVLIGLGLIYFATFLYVMPVIMLLLVAGIIYGTYKFVTRINTEYEYIVTNYELDVERIINRRTRKRIETVNLRLLEDFDLCGSPKEARYINDKEYKKIIACESVKEGYAFLVYTKNDKKTALFFTPNQKIIDHIRKVNPGKF